MEKDDQRNIALTARRGLTERQRREYSAAVCRRIMLLAPVQAAGTILSYLALPEETDMEALHIWAAKTGKTLAFPVTGPAGYMEAYVPEGPEGLAPGRFGIIAPVPAKSRLMQRSEPDIIIVPCVAFDDGGGRLGWGGGYYDRYLSDCPGALKIAAAFECQRLPRVAAEDHDAVMDAVVTEERIYRTGRGL